MRVLCGVSSWRSDSSAARTRASARAGVAPPEVDGGLVELHVGGLEAAAGGGEPLLGGLEVAQPSRLVAQAGLDPPLEPEEVEPLRLAGGEPVAMGAEQAPRLAQAAALDQEPELVVDGGEHQPGLARLLHHVEPPLGDAERLARPAGVPQVEPLGDQVPARHMRVLPLLVEGEGGVERHQGGVVAPPRRFQGGLELVEPGAVAEVAGALGQDLGGPVQSLPRLVQIAGDAAGVAVARPGPPLEVGHLERAVDPGVEGVGGEDGHARRPPRLLRALVAELPGALEQRGDLLGSLLPPSLHQRQDPLEDPAS